MKPKTTIIPLLAWFVLLAASCAPVVPSLPSSASQPADARLQEQAAAEATAIISKAKATAMVLEAQAEATAIMKNAAQPEEETAEPETSPTASYILYPTRDPHAPTPVVVETAVADADDAYIVELINVSYAGDGAFIIVNFRASVTAVNDFWPGRLSVTDESTGVIYNEVPSMPIIGPLIGRPKSLEQVGYVMLVNSGAGLPPGSLVTVELGKFKQEHVRVEIATAQPPENPTP